MGGRGLANGGGVDIKSGSGLSASGAIDIRSGDSGNSGDVLIASGTSTGASGGITLSAGDALVGAGASVVVSAGNAELQGGSLNLMAGSSTGDVGGDINIASGKGVSGNGKVTVASGASAVSVEDSLISVHADGRVSLTTPSVSSSGSNGLIGFGFMDSKNPSSVTYPLRVQSNIVDGKTQPMVIANAPLQATSIKYSSDSRIKENIQTIDEADILQRMKQVRVRSYEYSDDWKSVRGDSEDKRVRGVIAQELAKVFPEHVSVIPEYHLDDKNFTIKDFHQVDKTSLIFDTIAALQAIESRFSVSS